MQALYVDRVLNIVSKVFLDYIAKIPSFWYIDKRRLVLHIWKFSKMIASTSLRAERMGTWV